MPRHGRSHGSHDGIASEGTDKLLREEELRVRDDQPDDRGLSGDGSDDKSGDRSLLMMSLTRVNHRSEIRKSVTSLRTRAVC